MSQEILYSVEDSIATITLNRPERMNALGFEPIGSDGEEFATYIREEMAKYEKIINDAKIKVE